MNEEKIIDIETRLSYQDDALQQLSDVIYQQQKQIDKLERMMQLLIGKVDDLSERVPSKAINEKPPHY